MGLTVGSDLRFGLVHLDHDGVSCMLGINCKTKVRVATSSNCLRNQTWADGIRAEISEGKGEGQDLAFQSSGVSSLLVIRSSFGLGLGSGVRAGAGARVRVRGYGRG